MSKALFDNPIFVAIDTPDLDRALALARAVGPHVGGLKVGLEFITAQGPEGIRAIAALGKPVFADAKFHDMPNAVAGAVLTSIDDGVLDSVGQRGPAGDQVVRLAKLVQASGRDGVVCSAQEIAALRKACGEDFLLVVPGIRPAGSDLAGQRRVMTPAEAARVGADILVIGRPLTGAPDPARAA